MPQLTFEARYTLAGKQRYRHVTAATENDARISLKATGAIGIYLQEVPPIVAK